MAANKTISNNKYWLILFCLFLICSSAISQTNYLHKRITISFNDIPLEKALVQISDKGGFTFSYNTKHFDEQKLVSLNIENKTISRSLNQLFDNSVKYKVIGSHIVLTKKDQSQNLRSKNPSNEYKITGYIIDSQTGEKIQKATIYEINGRTVSLSNSEGYFSLTIPEETNFQGISYSKQGYLDTVIMVEPNYNSDYNIYLNPKEIKLNKLETKSVNVKLEDIHNRTLVDILVPEESKTISDNLTIHDSKRVQISLIPYIGTNRELSGSVDNAISFNVLAGYSGGVNGFELGGLLNIVRRDVHGSQIAGVANLVGGNTGPFQLAGTFNLNGGSVTGTQIAGMSNVVLDTLNGIQIAGFNNTLHGYMNGVQLSGFNNLTTQNVDGIQLTGFANVALKDVKLGQVSGFANYCDNVDGGQITGFANVAKGSVNWGQLAGFANYGNSIKGFQVAGFANASENDVEGGQIAGFANYGRTKSKFQLAGFGNIALEETDGVQLAAYFNYAKKVNGIQIALFNISDTIESGMPIGLFSFVKKGFHRIELTANEVFYANVAYKLGVQKFYNSIRFGYDFSGLLGVGYGIGTQHNINEKFKFNLDLSSDLIIETNSINLDLSSDLSLNNSSYNIIGTLNKITTSFDYNLSKQLSVFAGPSISVSAISLDDATNSFPNIAPYAFYNETFSNTQIKIWVGGIFGLSFTL